MVDVKSNLANVKQRIKDAEQKYGREPGAVELIAVSKTKPVEMLSLAIETGQRHFGENYVQEAIEKIALLNGKSLIWHFIGPIQSNKSKLIAESFDWVHSVDRIKIARRLSEQRPEGKAKLNICLQVNASDEKTKSGVEFDNLPRLVEQVLELPNLNLAGLMAIPGREGPFDAQCEPFHRLKQSMLDLNHQFGLEMKTLSMGMSGDLEAAISAGATFVRVGTDIFGERDYSV